MEVRPELVLQVVLVLVSGGARWRSMAERLLRRIRSPLGLSRAAFPSRILTRRIRMLNKEDLVVRQGGVAGGAGGWRLFGVEVRRLPVRLGTSSDPSFEWRSCGGAPSACPARRRRPSVTEGLDCILIFVGVPSVISLL